MSARELKTLIIYLVVSLLTQLLNMLLYTHKVDDAHASKGNLFQLVRKDYWQAAPKGLDHDSSSHFYELFGKRETTNASTQGFNSNI